MKLNITRQTNEHECGVCALTSLHNYYYNDSLDKSDVLDKCSISENGISIFDLETIGQKIGLELESYEISFSEFKNLKVNKYFILLVSRENQNHYVIVKKLKKNLLLFDSNNNEPKEISYKQLESMFLNVLILVNKKQNMLFNKMFSNCSTLLLFDLKFVLLNIFLSLLILTISVMGATYLNYVIDLAIGQGSLTNLITISFIYLLSYLSNEILTYVLSLYTAKHLKSYLLLLTSKILSSLQNKNIHFFDKVDKNWIFKIDECVYSISYFTVIEINKFITNIIFSILCICIIGSLQYWLLIFILFITIAEAIFFLFSYRKKDSMLLNIVKSENKNSWIYKELIDSMSLEMWNKKREQLISQIKNNYSDIYKNYTDALMFKENTNLLKGLLKSILEIACIVCMSYFVIKNMNFSVGKMIFCLSTFNLYKNASSDVFHYFLSKLEFNIYWQVFRDLTKIENGTKHIDFGKEKIKTITLLNNGDKTQLDIKKENLIAFPFIDMVKNSSLIKVNNMYDLENQNQIILVDEYSTINLNLFLSLMNINPKLFSEFIRYFKIDLNAKRLDVYKRIIINLMCLLNEKNQIIILDDIYKYMPARDKIMFNRLILLIQENNNVFFVRKEEND